MTIIRQMSLFSMQELYEMEPSQRYDAIISAIDLPSIVHEVTKTSHLGGTRSIELSSDGHLYFDPSCRKNSDDKTLKQASKRRLSL